MLVLESRLTWCGSRSRLPPRGVLVEFGLVDLEGVHSHHVAVRLVALRRAGPAQALLAEVGSPAPASSPGDSVGRLNTTQCHQPLPVGASGSWTVTAKLRVPFGGCFHSRVGDRLAPVQPKPLKTCASSMVRAGLMSGLSIVKLAAWAASGAARAMAETTFLVQDLSVRPCDRPRRRS